MRNYFVFMSAVAVFVVPFVLTGRTAAGQEILPAEVRDALTENAKYLNPISMQWTQQYQAPQSAAKTIAQLKIANPPDNDLFALQSHWLSYQNAQGYCLSKPQGGCPYECAFDGQILYVGNPDNTLPNGTPGPAPDLRKSLISRLVKEDPDTYWMLDDYFVAAGLWVPTVAADLAARNNVQPTVLHMLDAGARLVAVDKVTVDGQNLIKIRLLTENAQWREAENIDLVQDEVLLRNGRNSEEFIQHELDAIRQARALPHSLVYNFYLDPKMRYAMVRCVEEYDDGTQLKEINASAFKSFKGGTIWLPHTIVSMYYTWPSIPGVYSKSPILRQAFEMSACSFEDSSSARFKLKYSTAGTVVIDATGAGPPKESRIAASPAELDQAIQNERAIAVSQPPDSSAPQNVLMVVILVILPLLLLGGLIVWYRINHASKSH